MGYLTATLAHDPGTPLHSIAGLAKLLLEREDWTLNYLPVADGTSEATIPGDVSYFSNP